MAETTVERITFSPGSQLDQEQSPLLWKLPLEIQREVFSYALTDYEDLTNPYDLQTCYRRPDYLGPRRTDTALLRTCQRVYNEAWSMPWLNAQQTFFLTWSSRAPSRTTTVQAMQQKLQDYHNLDAKTKILNVQIFAQLCRLESGGEFQRILDMQYFQPQTITLTIRHTDFWNWESDNQLSIGFYWVVSCRFPDSLKEFRLQFESLERKKEQVDIIASQAVEKWIFQRQDGLSLSPSPKIQISRWSGCSTWEEVRWLRDEVRPEELDYYIATVSYFPTKEPRDVEYQAPKLEMPKDFQPSVIPPTLQLDRLHTHTLQHLNIPYGTSAAEINEIAQARGVDDYYGGGDYLIIDGDESDYDDEDQEEYETQNDGDVHSESSDEEAD